MKHVECIILVLALVLVGCSASQRRRKLNDRCDRFTAALSSWDTTVLNQMSSSDQFLSADPSEKWVYCKGGFHRWPKGIRFHRDLLPGRIRTVPPDETDLKSGTRWLMVDCVPEIHKPPWMHAAIVITADDVMVVDVDWKGEVTREGARRILEKRNSTQDASKPHPKKSGPRPSF